MSSSCRLLSNDTFPNPMHPLAPEDIEAQGRAGKKKPDKQVLQKTSSKVVDRWRVVWAILTWNLKKRHYRSYVRCRDGEDIKVPGYYQEVHWFLAEYHRGTLVFATE
ncbi:hypothetical protein TNCV_1017441 [Trichonephila clavipes]|uniref:Uncharacterized protein n=1 Tax=Trichonephila clavipes TaxID=2585209 RepID=A0A8X6VY35_TRICX|nr:hypothetical protein TNCV_1017441 [Trichonephila clavipes]